MPNSQLAERFRWFRRVRRLVWASQRSWCRANLTRPSFLDGALRVVDLGRMEYGACLDLQHRLRDERIAGRGEDTILIVEHPPVATLGRRGTQDEVFDKTLPVHVVERGGKATYHGPGQLVIYPIVHLGEGNRDVRAWVRHVEAFVIRLLGAYGITARARPDFPGVWAASGRKIASVGVAIQHWVSFHGVALNVDIDVRDFDRIDPCGLGAGIMTSMQREGSPATLAEVRRWAVDHAASHFGQFRANQRVRTIPNQAV